MAAWSAAPCIDIGFSASAIQSSFFRPGPFKEDVDVIGAQAFRSLEPDTSLLEVTLSISGNSHAVAHVMREGSTLVYFGVLVGPPIAQSALVVRSLRSNPQCSLQRNTASGPVFLRCANWEFLIRHAAQEQSLQVADKRRMWKLWIMGGMAAAAVAASARLIWKGYTKDNVLGSLIWNTAYDALPERVKRALLGAHAWRTGKKKIKERQLKKRVGSALFHQDDDDVSRETKGFAAEGLITVGSLRRKSVLTRQAGLRLEDNTSAGVVAEFSERFASRSRLVVFEQVDIITMFHRCRAHHVGIRTSRKLTTHGCCPREYAEWSQGHILA
ncbi:hypothetical protein BESB_040680 [Besnoitia besnoiti]|uniref:Transmembrane protein n=1 Tax=Besnoitia besnoiti TaxID=94643 RepID=A0A2A9MP86_BESBE|nr:hypothetical protein BESB_040680 [Besnoitia besnoiti]PFH37610.1 hypothetical protein BESB_040680 [Besnoitia besnoiti]